MPAKYRSLIKRLSETEDITEIILLTHELVSDIYERIEAKFEPPRMQIWWHLEPEYQETYNKIPWRKNELGHKTTERWILGKAPESLVSVRKEYR